MLTGGMSLVIEVGRDNIVNDALNFVRIPRSLSYLMMRCTVAHVRGAVAKRVQEAPQGEIPRRGGSRPGETLDACGINLKSCIHMQGGLTKEFYQLITTHLFNPDYGRRFSNVATICPQNPIRSHVHAKRVDRFVLA